MNYDIFSTFGHISVVVWLLMPVLFVLHWIIRPRGILVHVAVVLGVVAFALAKINSVTYVNRIEIDRSEQIALAQKAIEAERKRKEAERGEDVANIRFAEDSGTDYLDVGGMDDGDRAYYLGVKDKKPEGDDSTPAWKRQKRKRTTTIAENTLEGAIGATEDTEGVDATAVEEDMREPIIMSAADHATANRLDGLNLQIIRIMIVISLIYLLYDYLSRFNSYREAYMPLPLPAGLVNSITPLSPVLTRPSRPRRSVLAELKFLIRRGDSFLYMTDKPEAASSIPSVMHRLPFRKGRVEVLSVDFERQRVSSDFIFDALWFGRCAFIVDSSRRAEDLLIDFVGLLEDRKTSRARARHGVHLVWDMDEEPSDVLKQNISVLGPSTGFSLFVCSSGKQGQARPANDF